MPTAHAKSAPLQPRRFLPAFDNGTPRHWCGDDPALTHILNAYTLLVPGNEGYFIRALKRCLPLLDDPSDREMARLFMRQEGQHGAGHHRYWAVLKAQGYRIAGFQSTVDGLLYKIMEPLTPFKLRLSMVACVEHVNAYIGHEFLRQRILADAVPELRALFEWHFAEEIEHKHVAYEVLRQVAPAYPLRLLGAMMVLPMFYALSTAGMLWLSAQDGSLFKARTWRGLGRHLFGRHRMAARTCGHIAAYLRPGFDPWQLQDRPLANEVVERYTSPRAGTRMLRALAEDDIA
ncbi:MAG TPA: metal-dependent hydrolase [Luteimonas sp.]|nr:metal-dependent hydrolase [Luteimonas sp.]